MSDAKPDPNYNASKFTFSCFLRACVVSVTLAVAALVICHRLRQFSDEALVSNYPQRRPALQQIVDLVATRKQDILWVGDGSTDSEFLEARGALKVEKFEDGEVRIEVSHRDADLISSWYASGYAYCPKPPKNVRNKLDDEGLEYYKPRYRRIDGKWYGFIALDGID